jgi:hypothetical protein
LEAGEYSTVFRQPGSQEEEFAAYQAWIACPVGSIVTMMKNPAQQKDDVVEAARYAKHFGATRIIHRADASAISGAERVVEVIKPYRLIGIFSAFPFPAMPQEAWPCSTNIALQRRPSWPIFHKKGTFCYA